MFDFNYIGLSDVTLNRGRRLRTGTRVHASIHCLVCTSKSIVRGEIGI